MQPAAYKKGHSAKRVTFLAIYTRFIAAGKERLEGKYELSPCLFVRFIAI